MIKFNEIYSSNKLTFRILGLIILEILICRITAGFGLALLVVALINFMAKRKPGAAILCYVYLSFMINLSGVLIGGVHGIVYRGSFVVMSIMMIVQSSSRVGYHRIPLGGLYLYLIIAAISSIEGWMPLISYLKLLNFVLFLVALHIGTKNLNGHFEDIQIIRSGFMAFGVLLIVGSILVLPFPSIGYSMMVSNAITWGSTLSANEIVANTRDSGVLMFSGVTSHSQSLAPFTVCMAAWVMCDLLFVERRLNPLHVVLLACTPVVLFLTRSRLGLLSFVAAMALIYVYTLPKAKLPAQIRVKARSFFNAGIFIFVFAAIILECVSGGMSRWLRKTEDVAGDERDLSEAITNSRQGSIEENMYYFRRNPLMGTGFQVSEAIAMNTAASKNLLFSAPIEKGLLPLMILGETGVVGSCVFIIFLLMFYGTCARKRYYATATLFTVMLMSNMGEATFFSPTAVGGCFWMIAVAGGFAIDMYCASMASLQRMIYIR